MIVIISQVDGGMVNLNASNEMSESKHKTTIEKMRERESDRNWWVV